MIWLFTAIQKSQPIKYFYWYRAYFKNCEILMFTSFYIIFLCLKNKDRNKTQKNRKKLYEKLNFTRYEWIH